MKFKNHLTEAVLTLLWPAYMRNGNAQSFRAVLKHFFIQKLLRINSNIPWPVHWTSQVLAPEKIKRGTRAPGLSISCFIDGRNGIEFGDNVWIGPRVTIISQDHDSCSYNNYLKDGPIIIGKNSLITSNVIILPGIELGEHTIVASGAVVTKSFLEGNQIIGGNPARIIKKIEPYKVEK